MADMEQIERPVGQHDFLAAALAEAVECLPDSVNGADLALD